MAKSKRVPGIPGHDLKLIQQPDGKWSGMCSCGKWAGFGKTEHYVTSRWDKKHVNRFDNWK